MSWYTAARDFVVRWGRPARFAARQKDVEEEDGALMLCGTRVRVV